MTNALEQAVSNAQPLEILTVSWDGDALTLSGNSWSFNTASAWRISDATGIQFGCWDDAVDQQVAALVNLKIVGLVHQGAPHAIDPNFKLSDGKFLEVFSTTILEPWVMHLPDAIYVGGT